MRTIFNCFTDDTFCEIDKVGFIEDENKNQLTLENIENKIKNGKYEKLFWVDLKTLKKERIMHIDLQMMIYDGHTIKQNESQTPEEKIEEMIAFSQLKTIIVDTLPKDIRGKRVKIGDYIKYLDEKFQVYDINYFGYPDRSLAKKFTEIGWIINYDIPLSMCTIFTGNLDHTITTLLWYQQIIPDDIFTLLYKQKTINEFQDILFDNSHLISENIYIQLQNSLKKDYV